MHLSLFESKIFKTVVCVTFSINSNNALGTGLSKRNSGTQGTLYVLQQSQGCSETRNGGREGGRLPLDLR